MRVIARRVDWSECPPEVAPYTKASQTFLTVGKTYDVHAIAIFKGFASLQVIDDLGRPSWRASWLFDIEDRSLPRDWICNLLHEEPILLLGPEFLVKSEEAYGAMVELEADQVDRFWKRLDATRDEEEME